MIEINSITKIGIVLKNASSTERVVISEKSSFEITHGHFFYQRVPDIFYWSFPQNYRQQNNETIDFFYRVFGKEKVKVISDRFDLKIPYKKQWGLPITKADIEKIFAGAALIEYQDLERFFVEVKRTRPGHPFRHLKVTKVRELLQEFEQVSHFSHLSNAQLKYLYHLMIPFERIETIFLENVPKKKFSNTLNPKKNFNDLQSYIFLYEKLRRKGLIDLHEDQSYEVMKKYKSLHRMRMVKKMMNYHHRDGLVFDTPKGLMYQYTKLEAGGSYVVALKAIKPDAEKGFHSRLYFLPTQCLNRVPQPWESLADDLRFEIGAEGAKAIFEHIESCLMSTSGFIGDDEKIDLHGYSLGGNQASRVVCALYPRGTVRKLFITSNPGIDLATATYFAELVQKYQHKIKLSFAGEYDDSTMRFGNCQLGIYTDPKIVKICYQILQSRDLKDKISKTITYHSQNLSTFPGKKVCRINPVNMAAVLLRSLNDAHPRESYTVDGLIEHTFRNYSRKGEQLQEQEVMIRKGYLDHKLLTNIGYGWEEKRVDLLNKFINYLSQWIEFSDESYANYLKKLHEERV